MTSASECVSTLEGFVDDSRLRRACTAGVLGTLGQLRLRILWHEDCIYAEGRLVKGDCEAAYGGRRHFHAEHLGSTRLITTEDRDRLGRHEFYPFGQERTVAMQAGIDAGQRAEPMKFTGHQRDFFGLVNVPNDNYLDYMHARSTARIRGGFYPSIQRLQRLRCGCHRCGTDTATLRIIR